MTKPYVVADESKTKVLNILQGASSVTPDSTLAQEFNYIELDHQAAMVHYQKTRDESLVLFRKFCTPQEIQKSWTFSNRSLENILPLCTASFFVGITMSCIFSCQAAKPRDLCIINADTCISFLFALF